MPRPTIIRGLLRDDPVVAALVDDLFRKGKSCFCSAEDLAAHRHGWEAERPSLRVWAVDPAAKKFRPVPRPDYMRAVARLTAAAPDAVEWADANRTSRRLGPWYRLTAGPSLHAALNGLPRAPVVLRYAVRTREAAAFLAETAGPRRLAGRNLFATTVCGRKQWPELARWFACVGRLRAGNRAAALCQRFSPAVVSRFVNCGSIYSPLARPLRLDPLVVTVLVASTRSRGEVHVHRFRPDHKGPSGFILEPMGDFERLPPRRRYVAPRGLAEVAEDPAGFLKTAELQSLLG